MDDGEKHAHTHHHTRVRVMDDVEIEALSCVVVNLPSLSHESERIDAPSIAIFSGAQPMGPGHHHEIGLLPLIIGRKTHPPV